MSVDLIREQWGAPDSVRLVAAVLWRGNSDWALGLGAAESARARAATDSARRDARERGVQAAGTITATANALAEYDERAGTVSVLGRSYPVPARDSSLVLLVDRVDHIGGEPVITPAVITCVAKPDPSRAPGVDLMTAMRAMNDHWRTCLLHDSAVRAFVERGPAR